MSEAANPPLEAGAAPAEKRETLGHFVWFVAKLALAALAFRVFLFSPFSIPSESMLPRLMIGDYLVAAKWPYGYSRHSLPFGAPLIPGRVFAGQPEHGEVVIFKHPIDGADYIKRVMGLPGDTVEMRGGVFVLNGVPVSKRRIADFVQPVDPGLIAAARVANRTEPCAWGVIEQAGKTARQCRYARFVETLPNGVSYEVLDFGDGPMDNWGPRVVPEGTMFVMGDNRDNSQDSRFPVEARRGVGWVPQANLVGRASGLMWSTDGSAEWAKPWTWFTGARWHRVGDGM
jgi:signal peptidase I